MSGRQTEQIAAERIRILFQLADEVYPTNPTRAQGYVDLARRIAMRARIRLPANLRNRVCRRCGAFLVPGVTSRSRMRQRREPHVAVTCLKCGATARIPTRRRGP